MTLNDATRAQIAASNPLASTWLTANAGSGKTKVLTDRVARLLLLGVDPQSILCLTYTKAAAAEMQNRLFKRLGEWAMLPAEKLAAELSEAGVEGPLDLAEARTLFARAIEVPGGLKIQTIHAFAASILRRFPLEAGISPDFRELDDEGAADLRRDIVDRMAVGAPDIVAEMARFYSDDNLDGVARAIIAKREAFPPKPTRNSVAEQLGVDPALTPAVLIDRLVGIGGREVLRSLKAGLGDGGKNDQRDHKKLAAVDPDNLKPADHTVLEGIFIYGEKANAPFCAKVGKYPTGPTRTAMGADAEALDAMMQRAEDLREPRLALDALGRTLALQRFAAALLPAYERAKSALGVLDFDDLIARADGLLSDASVANWVLYRIDGDIEHVLVDEAQDTSPAQWRLIKKLTQELTSGQGAETRIPRSIFVVGDLKQSIYSFQGADPREMERMADHFERRLGGALNPRELSYSFRSSSAILRVVDQVLAPLDGQGVGSGSDHIAFHEGLPGRVDLWPIEEPGEAAADPDWSDPCDVPGQSAPAVRLARRAAAEIAHWLKTETIPAEHGRSRPVEPSDILLLFRKRSPLFHQTIRACKEAGLQVAGADRLLLQDDLGVEDIMSVLRFLALPEDDLALAEALRSPLFGWSEDALYRLAHDRGGAYLWTALRNARDDHADTVAVLDDLRGQADFLRPYEIMDRLLTRHEGRARLLARLGDETEEAIDVLLQQALLFESRAAPSLTAFIAWYSASEIEIKRQAPAADAGIRMMTVHGAKGLESPIVMILDAISDKSRPETLLFGEDGRPFMHAAAADRPAALEAASAAQTAKRREEAHRLMYVAMTRAENWLVVGGAGQRPTKGETWYEKIAAGVTKAGPTTQANHVDGTAFDRYSEGIWDRPLVAKADHAATKTALPDWLDVPRTMLAKPQVIAPSKLGGTKALPGDEGASTDAALAFGSALHLLLEHLPQTPKADRARIAQKLLADGPADLSAEATQTALRLLAQDDLSHLFGPDSLAEVDIVASPAIFDGALLTGSIDRLVIRPDHVLAVDFKSNRVVPERPAETPSGILRQLGAYAAALGDLYPDRRIETAVLWTQTATLMPIPHEIVRQALQDTAIS
ncbi:MAG: double-strand break repair helicase AddA [Pseudomonadota bacterium]